MVVVENIFQFGKRPEVTWVDYGGGVFTRSKAKNIGWKAARFDRICFVDVDIVMPPEDWEVAVQESGKWDVFSPYTHGVWLTRKQTENRVVNDRMNWKFPFPSQTPALWNLTGGVSFFKKSFLEIIDGWDERFKFHGMEDIAMNDLVRKLTASHSGNARALHLYHPPAVESKAKRSLNHVIYRGEYLGKPPNEIIARKAAEAPCSSVSLESVKAGFHISKSSCDRVPIKQVEYHVTDTCNLHCVQCSHYSNFTVKGSRSVNGVQKELLPWSERLAPKQVALLGGEPTVNKDLVPILYAVRELFPFSELMLVTNGFFLDRHNGLAKAIVELDVNFQISKHHESEEYNARFAQVMQTLEQWKSEYPGLTYNVRQSLRKWIQQYEHRDDGKAYPIRSRPTYAWKACVQKYCHQIYQGKLWKCPAIAYFRNLEAKLGLEEIADWNRFREYQPLSADCTTEELQRFVNEKAISACGLCPQNPVKIPIPNPMHLPVVQK